MELRGKMKCIYECLMPIMARGDDDDSFSQTANSLRASEGHETPVERHVSRVKYSAPWPPLQAVRKRHLTPTQVTIWALETVPGQGARLREHPWPEFN